MKYLTPANLQRLRSEIASLYLDRHVLEGPAVYLNDKVGRPRRANSSLMWGCARSEARPADQPPSTLTGRFALFLPHGPVAFRIRFRGAPRDGVEVLGEEEPGRDHPLKPQQLPLSVLHRI